MFLKVVFLKLIGIGLWNTLYLVLMVKASLPTVLLQALKPNNSVVLPSPGHPSSSSPIPTTMPMSILGSFHKSRILSCITVLFTGGNNGLFVKMRGMFQYALFGIRAEFDFFLGPDTRIRPTAIKQRKRRRGRRRRDRKRLR